MLHFVTSDLGLHCLPITILGVSGLKWVNYYSVHQCSGYTHVYVYNRYPKEASNAKKIKQGMKRHCAKVIGYSNTNTTTLTME